MSSAASNGTPARHAGTPRFVVIGAGTAGLLAAIKLREAGYHDVTVYEKADRIGGTWRENTYPGVACDVPAYLYSYSFAPNPEWSHVFAPGEEIEAYLCQVAARFAVDEVLELGVEVTGLEHDGRRWHLTLADGRQDVADVVVAATGVLHHPKMPDIDGLHRFAGPMFHSARWDHGVDLTGARIGVVGTGSSAVQIVTALAEKVGELHLFQRTAQWVLPLPNPTVDEEDRARYRQDPAAMAAVREHMSQTFTEHFADAVVDARSERARLLEELCRASLEQNVHDPVLREKLRPNYRAACKRLVMSAGFYDAVQRPSCQVATEPIAQVEPEGVRTADGQLHRLDVLVLATGFRVDQFLRPTTVIGPGGVKLDDVWDPSPYAYLSMSVPGFPNLFLLNGPNGPVGNFSLIEVAELQVAYLLQLLEAADGGRTSICARSDATERFEAARVEATKNTVWVTGCRSWYLDSRGIPAAWPWTFERFRDEMAAPRIEDFELERT